MSIEQQKEILAQWQKSPITRHYSFSDKRLWGKQEEILLAYRKHKRTVIKSGNTVGKTFIAADIVMDFLATNYPAKVITTAPGWNQVEGILWKEIGSYYNNSKIPIGGSLLNTELKFNDDWFATGISTNETVRFQGWHSPNLLVLIDEASGVISDIWDAAEALHPTKIVAIGNPLENTGKFFECFSSPLWHKITISGRECAEWQKKNGKIPGLVTEEWILDQEAIHGKKSAYVLIHVDGEFPEQSEGSLVSRAWVERARKGLDADGKPLDEDNEEDSEKVLAADIATKHGTNETVIGYRYGHTVKSLQGFLHLPTNESRNKIAFEHSRLKTLCACIDSDGIGEGVSDDLVEMRIPVVEFHGGYGQKAMDSIKFKNLRTQFYYLVAKKFEKGLYNLKHLDEKSYEIFKNQICSIKVKAPDALGRQQIETKEDMLARSIQSPDYADTFMMLEYAWYVMRNSRTIPYSYR